MGEDREPQATGRDRKISSSGKGNRYEWNENKRENELQTIGEKKGLEFLWQHGILQEMFGQANYRKQKINNYEFSLPLYNNRLLSVLVYCYTIVLSGKNECMHYLCKKSFQTRDDT